jgi:hypothetical protein
MDLVGQPPHPVSRKASRFSKPRQHLECSERDRTGVTRRTTAGYEEGTH